MSSEMSDELSFEEAWAIIELGDMIVVKERNFFLSVRIMGLIFPLQNPGLRVLILILFTTTHIGGVASRGMRMLKKVTPLTKPPLSPRSY